MLAPTKAGTEAGTKAGTEEDTKAGTKAGAPPNILLRLADGRQLCWAESGDPSGVPVMFFHGGPGSRLPAAPRQGEIAAARGVRLISVERPGFGESTRHPARTLAGWADDVRALADALGLPRFAVVGLSSGGPHALACAARLGPRVTRAVVVGCGAPWDLPALARDMDWPRRTLRALALHAPWLLRLVYRSLDRRRGDPEKLLRFMFKGLPAVDQALLRRPEILRLAVAHSAAAVAHGFDGMADEVLLLARPWGFELGSIAVPVTLWCGTEDTAAPLAQARHLAAAIPGAVLRPIDGEGHLCLFNHWDEILESTQA